MKVFFVFKSKMERVFAMESKKIVVKIGSSSLTDASGEIDREKMQDHVAAIARLMEAGHSVVLVSSGAVAAGFKKLGYTNQPRTIERRQAAAAVGQSLLMQAYTNKFGEYGLAPAQILLTRDDFMNDMRYKNAYFTMQEIMKQKLVPVINENDVVAVDELTFGDNDMLSALVSGLIEADHLILLTDINGLYNDNPNINPHARRYDYLEEITDEMVAAAGGSGSSVGTGGMKSKLFAANKAMEAGTSVFIGLGEGPDKLLNILKGKGDGTYIACKDKAVEKQV